jgi:hypothetical protein
MGLSDRDVVAAFYERLAERLRESSDDDGDDEVDAAAIGALTPAERAIYLTCALEEELEDGGWYLVFADEREDLIGPAIDAYEHLGLPAYASHLRLVLAAGYGDESSDDESERLDEAWALLTGADAARKRLIERERLAD